MTEGPITIPPEPARFYAHTDPAHPGDHEKWEPLFTDDCPALQGEECAACQTLSPDHGHLNKVAWWTAKFAEEMFPAGSVETKAAREWGYAAGLWHDLGKFAQEWQAYLKSKVDPHVVDASGTVPHSTAGAQHTQSLRPLGELFSYVIAGHHAGLSDGNTLFQERLKTQAAPWIDDARAAGVPLDLPIPMPPLTRADAGGDGLAFLTRALFSCLVDADFLATEAFMNPAQKELREPWHGELIDRMMRCLEAHMAEEFPPASPVDTVNCARERIRQACADAAERRPGFFSLTVPTGGGKTLSSLLFALRHAARHGLRRVIYVIPFTSIIQQNAEVFRRALEPLARELGRDVVLEHHSKFDPRRETELNRLAAENWDAPLVVTTNVQFFESLFANRAGACRKLHRIARSVVILDEVQALPSNLLAPILRGLRCLVHDLHTTAVLCTATQPAFERRVEFAVGIPATEIHPIIEDEPALFETLRRVKAQNLGELTDEALVEHALENSPGSALIVLNTTEAARAIHERISTRRRAFHLSARMCPRHVLLVLAQVKRRRKRGETVYLVSTQLIEAGVDISFPAVYRAECGLDSFAQAAGRCNRHGELTDEFGLPAPGQVFLFQAHDHPIPRQLPELQARAAITCSQVLPNHDDLLSLPAVRTYFEHTIWHAGMRTRWDRPQIVSGDMPCFNPNARPPFQTFDFARAARDFHIIENATFPLMVPWGRKGRALADEIRGRGRQHLPPTRGVFRRAQQFTVQVYEHEWRHLQRSISKHFDEAIAILEHPENDYDARTGLKPPGAPDDPGAFIH